MIDQEQVKRKLWDVLKALPYDGGPSTTRFVYLMTGATICIVILALAGAFCAVYVHEGHTASGVVAGLIGTVMATLTAFATQAQNKKNALTTGADPSDSNQNPQ